ncbi:uncharacterized protein LOC143174679 [Nomia melanderi]|uniref:uncharacterized protein LOC143174679 n=1 Tax=Nomia melanderi TaxID=2448451 RepID=UPI003FCD3896
MESHQARKTKKFLNSTISEHGHESGSTSSRRRTTFDFISPDNLTKTCATERISMAPSQLDTHIENEDTEISLLYNKYLQNLMTEIILKQKIQEKEKLIITKLATMAKEVDENKKKLFELKTRERDIIHLTMLQNKIDSQLVDIKKYNKSEDIKKVENILSQLHILLQSYDVLCCDNVILPKTPKEWEETIQAVKSCRDTLKSIIDLIGSRNECYQNVNVGLKDFLNIYNAIKDHHKRLEKDIVELQALALKTSALSLM